MKTLLMIAIMTMAVYGQQVATWTGNSRTFTSVTGKPAIACEYRMYNGNKFWRNFAGYNCPATVQVY